MKKFCYFNKAIFVVASISIYDGLQTLPGYRQDPEPNTLGVHVASELLAPVLESVMRVVQPSRCPEDTTVYSSGSYWIYKEANNNKQGCHHSCSLHILCG